MKLKLLSLLLLFFILNRGGLLYADVQNDFVGILKGKQEIDNEKFERSFLPANYQKRQDQDKNYSIETIDSGKGIYQLTIADLIKCTVYNVNYDYSSWFTSEKHHLVKGMHDHQQDNIDTKIKQVSNNLSINLTTTDSDEGLYHIDMDAFYLIFNGHASFDVKNINYTEDGGKLLSELGLSLLNY